MIYYSSTLFIKCRSDVFDSHFRPSYHCFIYFSCFENKYNLTPLPYVYTHGVNKLYNVLSISLSFLCRTLISLDLDSSDNISDEGLQKFLTRHGAQLAACCLSGMPHITDQLWMTILPVLSNAK